MKVTASCGCIFCDLGIKPTKMKRQWVHYLRKQGKVFVCPLKGIKPMSDTDKRGVKGPRAS